ncbi:STAS domain-containing protein [Streptomyces sp. cmx-4-9]|uniref:STAS domain-containing protein n=1 Tax=Streptomyces sp. cmx-4-9 TaxID=2790941 RepID=UPI00397EF57D
MEQRVQVPPDEHGVRVVICSGEFDADTLGPLETAVEAAVHDPTVQRIVLDVTAVEFADSTFLTLMLRLLHTGRLVLVGPASRRLNRVFDLTQAGDLFTVVDSVDAARRL